MKRFISMVLLVTLIMTVEFPARACDVSILSENVVPAKTFIDDDTMYLEENLVSVSPGAIVLERDVPIVSTYMVNGNNTNCYQKQSIMLVPKDEESAATIMAIVRGEHPRSAMDDSLSCLLYSTFSYAITSGISVWDYYYFTSPITGGFDMKDPSGTVVAGHNILYCANGASYIDGCIIQQEDEATFSASQTTWSVDTPSSWIAVCPGSDLGGGFGVNYFVTLRRTANGYTWTAQLINRC